MAVLGEVNWQGQQRVNLPPLRMVESGVRGDFDALAYMLVGEQPMIVRGFELLTNPIGSEASLLTFKVAGSKIVHPLASESGSLYAVPSNRANEVINPTINNRIQGSIQPQATNFIGIDLKRSADSTTADVVQFLNPSQNTESPQKIPLRRTLDYVWIVSQTDFTFNRSVCPVAIVTTNNLNVITAFQDARPLMGRLTPGGTVSTEINPYGFRRGRVPPADRRAQPGGRIVFDRPRAALGREPGGHRASRDRSAVDRRPQRATGGRAEEFRSPGPEPSTGRTIRRWAAHRAEAGEHRSRGHGVGGLFVPFRFRRRPHHRGSRRRRLAGRRQPPFSALPVRQTIRRPCIDGRPSGNAFRGEADYLAMALTPEGQPASRPLVQAEVAPENGVIERGWALSMRAGLQRGLIHRQRGPGLGRLSA